jgi:hypothetical protein
MEEIWKEIKGFNGRYLISNYGRIKSIGRNIGKGKGYYKPESILRLLPNKYGYLIASITTTNRKNKIILIHKEVARAFISNNFCSDNHICHIDGNKNNNNMNNLYIGNQVTNTIDKYTQNRTKLTIQQVLEIKKAGRNLPQKILAERYNVRQNYISRILSGTRCQYIN